ncbi:MAG: hypothetical protein P4L22_03475 [Candidatus Babeliales bacterium]|nr:hypothetical protein [Candidatus Babeliales bacterium]
MSQLSKDILSTLSNSLKQSQEFIERCHNFDRSCKTKYTQECDIQVDKDIIDADILLESVEKLSDLLLVHLQKCTMQPCVDASNDCKAACNDLMNSINDLISYCKEEENKCASRYQDVKTACENFEKKAKVCNDNYCNM